MSYMDARNWVNFNGNIDANYLEEEEEEEEMGTPPF